MFSFRKFVITSSLSLAVLVTALNVYSALPLGVVAGQEPTFAPMLESVMPGVVNISTRSEVRLRRNPLLDDPFFRHFFNTPSEPRQRQNQSLGSGVILDAEKGFVVTNHHVVKNADEIMVTLRDGRRFEAKVVGIDPEADIALIKIDAKNLTSVKLGNSEQLRVGDIVVAIGNPFGLGQTVTSGIISALGRSGLGIEGYENFIQTDASINPGNSGGALVNFRGELIGINTAIIGPSGGNVGIGFAIPSNMADKIITQLAKYGEVKRGQLGVHIQELTPELAESFGLEPNSGTIIAKVVEDSPADEAGVKEGDVVTAVNNKSVVNSASLRNAIGLLRIGDKVKLDIVRNGQKKVIRVVIGDPGELVSDAGRFSKLLSGAELSPIQPNHPLSNRIEGVEVAKIKRGSPAWNAGLRRGDIIVSVNRRPVKNLKSFEKSFKRNKSGILLNVQRGNGALFILIR